MVTVQSLRATYCGAKTFAELQHLKNPVFAHTDMLHQFACVDLLQRLLPARSQSSVC